MKINIFSVLIALLLLVLFAATMVVAGSNLGKNNTNVTYGMENPICFHCHAKRAVHSYASVMDARNNLTRYFTFMYGGAWEEGRDTCFQRE